MAYQQKIERKYLAHYIDEAFDLEYKSTNYVRLGKDLEEYTEELNPDVAVQKNILGEQSVIHSGYEVQASVGTYYAYEDEPLFTRLATIANERLTGTDCITSVVTVLYSSTGEVQWAYREDVWVVPSGIGGDTSGVQIPFSVLFAGNRTAGTFNSSTLVFTEEEEE